jgi:hypothetical protein
MLKPCCFLHLQLTFLRADNVSELYLLQEPSLLYVFVVSPVQYLLERLLQVRGGSISQFYQIARNLRHVKSSRNKKHALLAIECIISTVALTVCDARAACMRV